MKFKSTLKQSPFNEGGGIPAGMTGDLNGLNGRSTPNSNAHLNLCVLLFALLFALCAMPAFAQQENTISNDGTTSNFWSVGYDSSARLGIGLSWGEAIPNTLTLRDSGTAGSQTFLSGWLAGSGWKIDVDSSKRYRFTIDDITVRGTLSVYELLLNQIRASNGNLLITSSGVVDSVAKNKESFWCTDVTENNITPFIPGDIIICQSANMAGATFDGSGNIVNNGYLIKRLVFTVSSVNGRRVYVSSVPGAPAQKDNIRVGDVFCRIGNTSNANRMGVIGLYSDEANSPYLRVTDSVNSWAAWADQKSVRLQLGKLTGITDSAFGGQLEGYGLYATNVYLKGRIILTNPEDYNITMSNAWDSLTNKPTIFNAPTGKGLFLSANNMGYYNSTDYPADPWRTYMDNQGRFNLKGKGTHYLSWNDSILTIMGNITLTNTINVDKIDGLGGLAYLNSIGLDNITDGSTYARVLKTDISSGHIKLSESVGTLDDIDNGVYSKVLSTDISAGHIKITGSDGTTTVIDGGKLVANAIDGAHIKAGSIIVSRLSFTPVQNTNVVASINASAEGIRITGNKILIDGTVSFASGYNIADKLDKGDAANDINDNTTTIDGDKITTGTVSADKINVSSLSAITANLGTITAGTINAATVNVTNLNADNIKYGVLNADRIGSESITSEKIKTGTITAEDISAGAITTDKLTAGTLTGFTVQTASSGQRVVLSNSNNISFYDGNGTLHTTLSAVGTYHSQFNVASGYGLSFSASGTISLSAGVNPSTLAIQEDILTFDGQNLATQNWVSTFAYASTSSVPVSLFVANTSGGSSLTQLKTRSIKIGDVTFNVLVAP